ncbi:hypothetical protein PBI_MIMI_145 [Arthrobacter phage Mimi]|nr:hypothetical protein PBI_MIMI_225 [Arthrobacter phage Mimi]
MSTASATLGETMTQTREAAIYTAYKAAVKRRRGNDSHSPEVMAIVDVSEKLGISAILVLNIVKAREQKK